VLARAGVPVTSGGILETRDATWKAATEGSCDAPAGVGLEIPTEVVAPEEKGVNTPKRWGRLVELLLRFSRVVDSVNKRIGWVASWCVLLACIISAANATSRHAFSLSSNAWLEIQWYLFSAMFLLGASHTLKMNEHVRVDVVYASVSPRVQLWIDLLGAIVFLLPAVVMMAWLSWPIFVKAFVSGEMSKDAGGLIRWPVMLLIPVGFALLTLQGVSEVIKRIAALTRRYELREKYHHLGQ
jgi:TRAP-type mannitol/chloroaromatic compound transport system permease small subunit